MLRKCIFDFSGDEWTTEDSKADSKYRRPRSNAWQSQKGQALGKIFLRGTRNFSRLWAHCAFSGQSSSVAGINLPYIVHTKTYDRFAVPPPIPLWWYVRRVVVQQKRVQTNSLLGKNFLPVAALAEPRIRTKSNMAINRLRLSRIWQLNWNVDVWLSWHDVSKTGISHI